MPTTVRNAEYEFCSRQRNGYGLCPFCNLWHRDTDGRAVVGDCPGVYVRVRSAAFVVRGIPNTRAGVLGDQRVVPGGRNLQRAVAAAIKERAEA